MSDGTRDLLVRGVAAAKAGEQREAVFFLEWLLRLDPPFDQKLEAWYWLSQVSEDPAAQREYLEKILLHNPAEGRARRMLAVLDGRLDPDEIIDPDRVSFPVDGDALRPSSERFICPQCGGRLTYTASGQSLECEYCTSRRSHESTGEPVPEGDFHVALATARGHSRPVAASAVTCGGCGADLLLDPGNLSGTCPYCCTAFAIQQVQAREIVPPDGILPFLIDEGQADAAVRRWAEDNGLSIRILGIDRVYLPLWTFDIGGQVFWKCRVKNNRKWVEQNGQEIVYHNDLPVPAVRRLPDLIQLTLPGWDLSKMVTYDTKYLAGIQAENYDVSAGDASLYARKAALEEQRKKIADRLPAQIADLNIDSTGILVETFRLLLAPACLVRFASTDSRSLALVNGQSGAVAALAPGGQRSSLLNWLFG